MWSVDDTRAKWQRTRFVWGETDCIMSMCNHVMDVTGRDPAAPWRGAYSDEAGARAIYEAHGGPLGLVRHGMALAGFVEGEAVDGSPVVAGFQGHEIAGIMCRGRVCFMMEGRGMLETRAQILGAWVL